MLALFMGMFTANLDSTILASAIPRITDDFHSLGDIGWYVSSAFLTFAAFQTNWGKVFKYFHLEWSYLLSLLIFELGSLLCAVVPSSATLITGRAIAGIGAAGLCTGTFVIIGYSVEHERQPAFMDVMDATYTLASFIGPLPGGAFTERISWR
ncbi:major facilitator superfamily domain-containing protein [Aspergillus alliaceus]|uniref:Major facilitator superfamily domain-containing protein n=1 Tax=Petromyces alliaceus TaxID=209559 RepID=A0A5N7CGY4_PETAA|nr:major facilitator superfamily domain-containing protein [Aspergillus alliaceus]